MITLFHGSYISVQAPLVKLGRKKVDFGQGFYLTNLRKQAEAWAKTIAERKGRNTQPAVATFLFGKRACYQRVWAIRRSTMRLILLPAFATPSSTSSCVQSC
ncbi:MAG: DUF3990 domain-containing protein [Bacteroidales bacterium]|nr:DUF3990 domain-containing protein [Bacteroidales bacterium]